jgi:hypothetical protein
MTKFERRQLAEAANTILNARERVNASELERRNAIEREWEEREYQSALHEAATSAARRSQ